MAVSIFKVGTKNTNSAETSHSRPRTICSPSSIMQRNFNLSMLNVLEEDHQPAAIKIIRQLFGEKGKDLYAINVWKRSFACYIQKKQFLHDGLREGLYTKLVAGMIGETVSIAIKIKNTKLNTTKEELEKEIPKVEEKLTLLKETAKKGVKVLDSLRRKVENVSMFGHEIMEMARWVFVEVCRGVWMSELTALANSFEDVMCHFGASRSFTIVYLPAPVIDTNNADIIL
ncbi:hypothetical protein Tco_0943972 [Tanacetum coccineum]